MKSEFENTVATINGEKLGFQLQRFIVVFVYKQYPLALSITVRLIDEKIPVTVINDSTEFIQEIINHRNMQSCLRHKQ